MIYIIIWRIAKPFGINQSFPPIILRRIVALLTWHFFRMSEDSWPENVRLTLISVWWLIRAPGPMTHVIHHGRQWLGIEVERGGWGKWGNRWRETLGNALIM